ncbi:MAG: hypothetical protein ACQEUM_12120 [Pseudomonadota bacterium]
MGMYQMPLFGGMPTKDTTLPAVGTVCARCLWLMLNRGWCDNHRLADYGIANASRRMMDLRDRYGWAIVTQSKRSRRPDGEVVPISEYRIEPVWINELVGSDPVFKERLLLWSRAQNDHEHGGQRGDA